MQVAGAQTLGDAGASSNPAFEIHFTLARVPEHVLTVVDQAYFEYVADDDYPDAVEEDDALGQHVDGFAQPPLGVAGVQFRPLQGVLVPAAQKGGHGHETALEPSQSPPQSSQPPTHATIPTHARPETGEIG